MEGERAEGSLTYLSTLMDYVMELAQFRHADLYSICRRLPGICPRKTAPRTVLLSEVNPIIPPMSVGLSFAIVR